MSGLILPALAIGGVYILYDGLTKKKHKSHSSSYRSSSSYSSSSRTRRHRRKTPKSSASSMEGLRVKHNQTRKRNQEKKEESVRKLYVYYMYGSVKGKKWAYKGLPSDWSLKKKADVNKDSKYTKLNVFSGPKKNRDAMKKYLEDAFDYLKKKNIVKYYKIDSHE